MESRELQVGTTLCNGKYTIEKYLNAGGFGITYKAVQSGLNRVVCIKEYFLEGKCVRNTVAKTVHLQGIDEEAFEKYRQRFVEEARLLASFRHSNIVEVIDVFDENNTSYMVMTFIEGITLQSMVEKNGKLDYITTVNYLGQIADAVKYVHARHYLHRDIKPDNMMITRSHHAILIDFGSAREFEHDKTQHHTSILTKCYAPPEQYNTVSRKGNYTDIYALGAVYYFAMTGKEPIEATTRQIERMPEPKELNPTIPDDANRTILKAMSLKPENRHQNIQEFLDDLLGVKPSEPVTDDNVIIVKKSNKKLIAGIIAGTMLAIVIALCVVLNIKHKNDELKNKYERNFAISDFTNAGQYPMVLVKGGSFIMGCTDTVSENCEDDNPPHKVNVSDFYIGQFEVCQKFWKEIMGTIPNDMEFVGDSLPVVNVSFEDVQLFIQKLNRQTGQQFSLPTEAQWEYAARGGEHSQNNNYAAGEKYPATICYNTDKPRKIHAIKPNEIGAYHQSGNVAEWCLDYYDEDFYTHCSENNPVNNKPNILRIVRGGSYNDVDRKDVTVFVRNADDRARSYIGFRLVLKK